MRQTATIKVYKFDSFTEILNWLREDWRNRTVFYQNRNHELAVFLSYNEATGKNDKLTDSNVDTFSIINGPHDKYPDVESLEEYFDENDNPMEDRFAEDFAIADFFGEEYEDLYKEVGVPVN